MMNIDDRVMNIHKRTMGMIAEIYNNSNNRDQDNKLRSMNSIPNSATRMRNWERRKELLRYKVRLEVTNR
jgi:hypothetical protein